MIPEKFWLLLSLKLSGEASPADISELEELLNQYPQAGFRVEQIQHMWTIQQPLPSDADSFVRHMKRLKAVETAGDAGRESIRLSTAKVRRLVMLSITAAASVLLIFFIQRKDASPANTTKNAIATKAGSRSTVQLPDGTMVWLNADSKLVYDEHFNGSTREVALTGEAFFDVSHDASRPFIIHAKSVDIKVLGTAFNVRSYPDETNTETSVLRGSVQVTMLKMPGKQIVLKPDEKLVVRNDPGQPKINQKAIGDAETPSMVLTSVHKLEGDSTTFETSWVRNKLAFDQQSLASIAQQIGRWYNMKVVIANPALGRNAYSGVFDGEPVEQVLDALKLTGKFQYKVEANLITIY